LQCLHSLYNMQIIIQAGMRTVLCIVQSRTAEAEIR
jgi:hypothetical protein